MYSVERFTFGQTPTISEQIEDAIVQHIPPAVLNGELSLQDFRDWIMEAERRIDNHPTRVDGDVVAPITNFYTPGLYVRQIFMPAGLWLTSWIHKYEHPYVVSKGDCSVITETGVKRIRAPYTGITKPGTKRLLFIHEDVIWSTFHVSKEDLSKLPDIEIKRTLCVTDFEDLNKDWG